MPIQSTQPSISTQPVATDSQPGKYFTLSSSLMNLEFHTPHIFPSLAATSSNQQNIAHQLENSDASNTPHAPTDSSSHRTFNHRSKIHFLIVSPFSHLFLSFTQSPLFLCFLGTIFNPLSLGAPTFSCRHCGAFFWYEERVRRERNTSNPTYNLCCKGVLALFKYPFYPLFILDNGMDLISKSLTVLTPA